MITRLEKITQALIGVLLFTPLVVSGSTLFPTMIPKVVVMCSLVTLLLGCYLCLLFADWSRYRPRWSWVTAGVLLFFVSMAISTWAGVDPYHSFWDEYDRMEGLFIAGHYVVLYFVLSAVLKNRSDWERALQIFMISGMVASLVGLIQVSNPMFLFNNGEDRVASTIGNPIYFGGYTVFLLFVSCFVWWGAKNKLWQVLALLSAVLALAGLIFSGSRGSLAGLAAGLFVLLVGYSCWGEGRGRRLAMGILGVFVACSVLGFVFRSSSVVTSLPVLKRLSSTTVASVTNSARWVTWQIAWRGFKARPVLGWGPSNFNFAFNADFDPKLFQFGYTETRFDNAHNIILNILAEQGVVGILAYFSIYIGACIVVVRAFRQKRIERRYAVGMLAFLAAHFVNNLTIFDNPTSHLYFMFWLAMIHSLTSPMVVGSVSVKKIGWGSMTAIGLFVGMSIYVFDIRLWSLAAATKQNIIAIRNSFNITVVEAALQQSTPHIDSVRGDILQVTVPFLLEDIHHFDQTALARAFPLLEQAAIANHQLHPLDLRNDLLLVRLMQIGYDLSGDGAYFVRAEQYLASAFDRNPRRQQILFDWSVLKATQGQWAAAEQLIRQGIALNPRAGEGYSRLATIFALQKKTSAAQALRVEVEKNHAQFLEDDQAIFEAALGNNQ